MDTSVKIFLNYAEGDEARVREIYECLKARGEQPWMEEEDLQPGDDRELVKEQAIRNADMFLACLSSQAVDQAGTFRKDWQKALDVQEEKVEGDSFIIPVRLDDCPIPDAFERWHWVKLYEERGWEKLEKAIDDKKTRMWRNKAKPCRFGWIEGQPFVMGFYSYDPRDETEGENAPVFLDWRGFFQTGLPEPSIWQTVFLPELKELRRRVQASEITLYSELHLSIAIALGYTFSGFDFQIYQNKTWWGTKNSFAEKQNLENYQRGDVFSCYEDGLRSFNAQLDKQHPRYSDFLVYQQRLQENIAQARRYGNNDTLQSGRAEIIDQLNSVGQSVLGVSFNELCNKQTTSTLNSSEQLPNLEMFSETLDRKGTDISLEVGIPRDVSEHANCYIREAGLSIRQRIRLLVPEAFRNPVQGRTFVQGGRHAQILAEQIASVILQEQHASTIHLFASLPKAIAVLVGTHLNKAQPIQCYEYRNTEPFYLPSCRLG
jgi:hypothetical protein